MRDSLWLKVARLTSVMMLATGCAFVGGSKPPPSYRLVKVDKGNITETVNPAGTVAAKVTANLNFPLGGTFKDYQVSLGETVEAGQVLADLESATQQQNVAAAEAALAQAKAKLDGIKAGPLPGAVAQAQGSVAQAQAKLDGINAQGRAASIAQARATLDAAMQKLAAMKGGPQQASIDQATSNAQAAKAAVQMAQSKLDSTKATGPLVLQQAELKLESAKSTLLSQQTNRDGACGSGRGGGYQCQSANASVDAASVDVTAASKALSQQELQNEADVKQATASLVQAQANLAASKAALQLAAHPFTSHDLAQQQDVVAEDQAALDLAETPYSAADRAAAEAALQSAQGALVSAQRPYSNSDLASAQAAFDQSAAQLRLVEAELNQTKLVAPFAGIILAENAAPGNFVGTSSNPVVLGTAGSQLEVVANVDEVDIGKVKVGQSVTMTADAFPGLTFHGHVDTVPPQGTTVQNVVTYPTYISLDGSTPLRPSMTVQCAIAVAHKTGVLRVPSAAISENNGKTYVMLLEPGQTTPVQRKITVGLSSISQSEVLSGLKLGDEVALGLAPRAGGGLGRLGK